MRLPPTPCCVCFIGRVSLINSLTSGKKNIVGLRPATGRSVVIGRTTLQVVPTPVGRLESWMASLRSLPRLRATLSIATCFVPASSAGYFSSALRRVARARGDCRLVSERGDLRSFPDFQEGMEVSQR